MVPQSEEEIRFDEAMAKAATELAMTRHCGVLECVYTPMELCLIKAEKI